MVRFWRAVLYIFHFKTFVKNSTTFWRSSSDLFALEERFWLVRIPWYYIALEFNCGFLRKNNWKYLLWHLQNHVDLEVKFSLLVCLPISCSKFFGGKIKNRHKSSNSSFVFDNSSNPREQIVLYAACNVKAWSLEIACLLKTSQLNFFAWSSVRSSRSCAFLSVLEGSNVLLKRATVLRYPSNNTRA